MQAPETVAAPLAPPDATWVDIDHARNLANVCVHASALPGAGHGLFSRVNVAQGDVVVCEQAMVATTGALTDLFGDRFGAVTVSPAWYLAAAMCVHGPPTFLAQLARNRSLVQAALRSAEDQALMRELMQRYPSANVIDTFGACITNFSHIDGISSLSFLYSKMNHSREPNIVAELRCRVEPRPEGAVTLRASRAIKRGDELCIDYGPAHAAFF